MVKPPPAARRSLPVVTALALLCCAVPLHAQDDPDDAQNRPPSMTGDDAPADDVPAPAADPQLDVSPGNSAVATVTVQHGKISATVGLMNPGHTGAPLLLWVEPQSTPAGQLIIESWDGDVLWRAELHTLRHAGQLIAVPRTTSAGIRAFIHASGSRSPPAELSLSAQRADQQGLPFLVVGGAHSLALADALREQTPGRLIHWIPPSALPTTPAAFLGTSAVILGPDANILEKPGRALRLLHCARGGVVSLGSATLPTHGSCQDPPQLVGPDGKLSPRALTEGLRDFQVTLGLLEERTMGFTSELAGDAQAASGLLAHRPDARLGVGAMVAVLIALGASLWWTRRYGWKRAVLIQGAAPALGALAVGALALTGGQPPVAVRLVTVDAREGAPVAFVRTVESASVDVTPPPSDTAWVVRVEPAQQGEAHSPIRTQEVWDVVDVTPLRSMADPQDGNRFVVTNEQHAVSGFKCGAPDDDTGLNARDIKESLGRLLLERCQRLRGVVAPLHESWAPDVKRTFSTLPGGAVESRWTYLLPSRGSRL